MHYSMVKVKDMEVSRDARGITFEEEYSCRGSAHMIDSLGKRCSIRRYLCFFFFYGSCF